MNLINYLSPRNLPASARQKDTLSMQREMILQNVLNLALAIATVGLPVVLFGFPQMILSGNGAIYVSVYLLLAALTIARTVPYPVRAAVIILALQIFGVAALLVYGLSGTGPLFLLGSAVLAHILFNAGAARFFTLLALIELSGIGALMVTGAVPVPPVTEVSNSSSVGQWAVAGMVFLFLVFLSVQALLFILKGMEKALRAQQDLTAELVTERSSLERRVEERASELRNRIAQFEIASDIAREISGEPDLEKLLNRAVNLIRDQFGFYHVGVFLNDERGQYAILRAATGEAGRAMLEHSHRLKIGEMGMVGYAAGRGEARIASNVAGDAVHFKNPLLPDTRSEMALPLRLGDRTIGALDVQSVIENAFAPEDIRILQTIADQLAIAFDKTRLLQDLQKNVREIETAYQASTQRAWRAHLRSTRQKMAYRYRDSRLEDRIEESLFANEAMEEGRPVLKVIPVEAERENPVTVLAVPIKLRNQVLGVVDIRFGSATVSPDLISLIEGTVNRLAVSLDNARLLEEIQMRAERERLVSEVSSKVRAASDVDSVLRIAVQEIGRSLGAAEVTVQLRKES